MYQFYLIGETKLPTFSEYVDTPQLFDKLVNWVTSEGSLRQQLELQEFDFIEALEYIDHHIEGDGFLPILTFNNSPRNILVEGSPSV